MVDYFLIRTKVENQVLIDEQTKRPYQIYTYIVSPYKVHYTRVPNYRDHLKDLSKLQNIVARKYEYIYTGQNVDIINFKLISNKFDNYQKFLFNLFLKNYHYNQAKTFHCYKHRF